VAVGEIAEAALPDFGPHSCIGPDVRRRYVSHRRRSEPQPL